MDKEKLIDLIDEFKSGLLAKATDGDYAEPEYKRIRDILLKTFEIKDYLPRFIKSNRTAHDFRIYMQGQFEHYKERRAYINSELNTLVEYIESEMDQDSFSVDEAYTEYESLGNGGFGAVYKFYNKFLDKYFAVKVYSPMFVSEEEQREGEKRFFREAKMLFNLQHPNIVSIYDAGKDRKGNAFIKMELIEGYDLKKLHDKYGNLSFSKSVIVIKSILKALSYAHSKDIIHRDLKPSNVMFSTTTKEFKVIDFGVSAFLDVENHTRLTKTGEHIAGGIYIDPILQENPKMRDVRSDIYSVGAIWYFLLAGKAPSGGNMREYLEQASPELAEDQVNIIMKCLSTKLDDRYDACEDILELLY